MLSKTKNIELKVFNFQQFFIQNLWIIQIKKFYWYSEESLRQEYYH